ncbi:MAG: type II toxin-antitoxin system RelE/ParE family toxin [Caldilineales bacterium]|nr:type II toxin-antitoxin system RelE/ParE family toxin [Caldilineales bacterium]MCW5861438.1 type II toxin-antitoxin system RelE/ParE family toxin [Caldilineales bacterium]
MRSYTLYVWTSALAELKQLPGNVRQVIRRAIDDLADDPRPSTSKALRRVNGAREWRRLSLGRWRVIYLVYEVDKAVEVLAVRRRPPYDYGDLEQMARLLT